MCCWASIWLSVKTRPLVSFFFNLNNFARINKQRNARLKKIKLQ